MRSSLLLLVMLLAGVVANAQVRNPQMRLCYQLGGEFLALDLIYPIQETVGLCRFGKATIGALALTNYITENFSQMAVRAYEQSTNFDHSSCHLANGLETDLFYQGKSVAKACLFLQDNSLIELETLQHGYNHPENWGLNQALKGF